MKQVVIYVDEGVSGPSLRQTVKSLQQELTTSYSVKRMDAKALLSENWPEQTALLVVPGGRDVYYHQKLDGKGTDKIKTFIQEGGRYLGICAGAYFACQSIEFEKGGQLEVCAPRSLGFFPGKASGPAYGPNKYCYDSEKGAEAARINWQGETCSVYFNGGCLFVGADAHENVQVLASYADLPNSPAAIIGCSVGRGKAILSGVHMEYSAHTLPAEVNPDLHHQLMQAEETRRLFFRNLLIQLDIQLVLLHL